MVCPEEDGIFKCTRDNVTLINWRITSTCGSLDFQTSFSSTSSVGQSLVDTLCFTPLTFTFTSLTRSSIQMSNLYPALNIHYNSENVPINTKLDC